MQPDSSFNVLRSECSSPVTPALPTATFSVVSVNVLSIPSASASVFSFSVTISICSPFAYVMLRIVLVLSSVPSIHVVFDMIVVKHDVIYLYVHRVQSRTSTMSFTCFVCRLHAVIHHASCAHSFDFFRFRFRIFAFCFCCCCVLIFCLCFCIFTFCLRCDCFLWRRFFFEFFSMIPWYLFSSSGFSTSMFFQLGHFFHALSCRIFPEVFAMATLSRRGDRESCHDTSVVTSHVDHVVGFGVLVVSQVSSLG